MRATARPRTGAIPAGNVRGGCRRVSGIRWLRSHLRPAIAEPDSQARLDRVRAAAFYDRVGPDGLAIPAC